MEQKSGRKLSFGRNKLIALVLAAITLVGIVLVLNLNKGGVNVPGVGNAVQVVVASRDISLRENLDSTDTTVQGVDPASVPTDAAFTSVSQLTSMVAAANFPKGAVIFKNQVVSCSGCVTPTLGGYLPIPRGYVAVTMPNGSDMGVANYIQPGDYITIMVTVSGPGGTTVHTIYTNLHVVRIGINPGPAASSNPSSTYQPGGTLIVVVTQCQAEILRWMASNTSMIYTLPAYQDYKPGSVTPDPTCPSVDAALQGGGVNRASMNRLFPGLFA